MKWWQIGKRDADLDRELRSDLDLEEEEQRENGLPAEEARYAARRAFGNATLIREQTHEAWGWAVFERLLQDLRFASRVLIQSPAFAGIAVLTLAIGIGATTAIFSVVNGVILKPLPYSDPERLVSVELNLPGIDQFDSPLSSPDYFIFREQSRTFQDIGLYALGMNSTGVPANVTGLEEPEHVLAARVTDGLLPVLGIAPLFGRPFTRADDSPGSAETVMLTYGYWQRRFGNNRSVIGKTIDVNGAPHVIIGVLPRDFQFLDRTNLALFLPLKLDRASTTLGNYLFPAIARLKPGATLAEANADVARMIPIVLRSFALPPGFSLKQFEELRMEPNLKTLKQEVIGDVNKVLWVLMGGIALVLFIACANMANAVRSPRAGSEGLVNEIKQAVWSISSSLPLAEVHTLDYYYTKSMARTSFALVMLALAGGMALLLGIVGLYGVIAYSVSQRTHELGIRMALGAQTGDVLKLILGQRVMLTLVGVSIGIASALAATRFLSTLLYGVKQNDPLTFAAVSVLLIVVAVFASYIPARRAAKVDPMVALRYE
ncbi:MAG: ABC transporter permease [Terracidiphilus sp.]|jgi:ABC-type antimicrobial peptide transport system permease subunit